MGLSYFQDASVVVFLAPGPDARWIVMNVGVSYDANSSYRNEIPAVSSRSLKADRTFQLETPEMRIFFKMNSYIVKYVYGFSSSIFSYFVTIQLKENSSNASAPVYVTKLVRICQGDEHYWSYAEIPIECTNNGEQYNLVQAAYLSKPTNDNRKNDENGDVLYAVFSKGINGSPSNQSALCTYSLESIEEKFRQNIQSCYDGVGHTGLDFISPSKPCEKVYTKISKHFCGSMRNSPFGGGQAIRAESVAILKEQTRALVVAQFNRNALILIGTGDGRIKKFTVQSDSTATQTDDIRIFNNSAINGLHLDSQALSVYAISSNQLVKLQMQDNCSASTSCDACVSTKSPYCGWCPHGDECTLESDCLDQYYSSVSWKNYVSE